MTSPPGTTPEKIRNAVAGASAAQRLDIARQLGQAEADLFFAKVGPSAPAGREERVMTSEEHLSASVARLWLIGFTLDETLGYREGYAHAVARLDPAQSV